MRINSAISKFVWKEISDGSDEAVTNEKLREHLSQRMQSSHLAILFGAGASKAVIIDPESPTTRAPLMTDIFKELKENDPDFEKVRKEVNCLETENFEEILSRCILHEKVGSKALIKNFIIRAKSKIVEKTNFLKQNSDLSVFEAFLRSVTLRNSKNRSNIFTLNYDLTVETAAAKIGFTMIDGFSFNYPHHFSPLYFDYDIVRKKSDQLKPVESVAYLYKLHGSINWLTKNNLLVRLDSPEPNPELIFPTKEKFQDSFNQPFLEMVTRFKEALRCPQTTLVVIGYSCGDEHINSIISNSLDINYDLNVIFIDPKIENSANYKYFLQRGLANDNRLTFFEATLEDLVKVVPSFGQQSKEEMFIKSLMKVVQTNAG